MVCCVRVLNGIFAYDFFKLMKWMHGQLWNGDWMVLVWIFKSNEWIEYIANHGCLMWHVFELKNSKWDWEYIVNHGCLMLVTCFYWINN